MGKDTEVFEKRLCPVPWERPWQNHRVSSEEGLEVK